MSRLNQSPQVQAAAERHRPEAPPSGPPAAPPDLAILLAALEEIRATLRRQHGLEPSLLAAKDFARLLRVSKATFCRLKSAGKLPRPLDSLGQQLLRWRLDEVRTWIEAGMVPLAEWEAIKRAGRR